MPIEQPKTPAMQMLKLSRERATKIALGIINDEHDDLDKTIAILESEHRNYQDVIKCFDENKKVIDSVKESVNVLSETTKNLVDMQKQVITQLKSSENTLLQAQKNIDITLKEVAKVLTDIKKVS